MKKQKFNEYYEELNSTFKKIDIKQIKDVLNLLSKAKPEGKNIYIIGNGGSAATAEHWANDFLKIGRLGLIPLTCLSTITAYANDVSYECVFTEQLKMIFKEGDILIVITGSGNSKNIISALKYCCKMGITIGILGFDGGEAKDYCDSFILVPSKDYGILEDIHLSLGHYLARSLK